MSRRQLRRAAMQAWRRANGYRPASAAAPWGLRWSPNHCALCRISWRKSIDWRDAALGLAQQVTA